MPSERPTARQAAAEQTRQKLLAAAVSEFSQRPYDEVTVAGIARTAGVAHGLVSHHFQGKQGAYTAAVNAVYNQLRAAEDATDTSGEEGARPTHDTPGEASLRAAHATSDQGLLRGRFRRFLVFIAARPETALNLVLASGRDPSFVDRRTEGLRVIAGLRQVDFAEPAVAMALGAFADAAEGLSADWLRRDQPFPVDAMVDAFVALLDGALAAADVLR